MGLRQMQRLRRSHLFWHLVFFGIVLGILFMVIRGLGRVLTPVAAALVLSYLLDPLVSKMERRFRFPRWLGSLLLFILTLLICGAVILFVLPVLIHEIHAFAESVPLYLQKIWGAVIPWAESTFKITIPGTLRELVNQFGADVKALASKAVAPLGSMAGEVAQRAAGVVSTIMSLFLVPIFTFYFLPKFPGIMQGAQDLIPRRYLSWVRDTASEVDRTLSAWIRGQLTVIAVLATLYSVGLSIVGIKMAVLIGLITGLLAFIPYVGVVIGATLAVLVCLLEYNGPSQLVWVAVVFGSVQVFDGLLLTPVLVGERVGIGPVGVLLALMLGGHLFGFVGVLLAVPTAASLVVVLKRAISSYKDSLFYQRGEVSGQELASPQPQAAEEN